MKYFLCHEVLFDVMVYFVTYNNEVRCDVMAYFFDIMKYVMML